MSRHLLIQLSYDTYLKVCTLLDEIPKPLGDYCDSLGLSEFKDAKHGGNE